MTGPDVSEVVPRWEWRTFGDAVDGPAAHLAGVIVWFGNSRM